MLNRTGVKKETIGAGTQILADVNLQHSVGIVIKKGEGTDVNGRKIVKAGTPMKGSLQARTTEFTVAKPSETAVGVLLHDVDTTDGKANGTLLDFGFVDVAKVDKTVAANYATLTMPSMIQLIK